MSKIQNQKCNWQRNLNGFFWLVKHENYIFCCSCWFFLREVCREREGTCRNRDLPINSLDYHGGFQSAFLSPSFFLLCPLSGFYLQFSSKFRLCFSTISINSGLKGFLLSSNLCLEEIKYGNFTACRRN